MDTTPADMIVQAPTALHPHLDSIQVNTAGGVFLAASSLTGRFWKGSLWFFDEANKAGDVQQAKVGVELDSGTADIQLISDNKVVIASDSGVFQIWEVDSEKGFVQELSQQGHDDVITSISLNGNKEQAVTGSYDCKVKVWDLENGLAKHTFKGHYDIIHSVAFHPSHPDVFASCSQDGTALVWDLRKSYPAQKLDISTLKSTPTCIAWKGNSDMVLAIGTENGSLSLLNSADMKPVSVCKPHGAALHRILIHPEKRNWIASTSYDSAVAVTNFQGTENNIIYKDNRHKDFSRGISWQNSDTLISCGWDKQVLSHSIVSNMEQNGHDSNVANSS